MIRLITATCFLVLLYSPALVAQEGSVSFTVYGSVLTPAGKYGEKIGYNAGVTRRFGFDIGEEVGLSSPGFGLGIEFRTVVLTKGLEWAVSLQGLTNKSDATEVTRFFEQELGDTVAITYTAGRWYHIPLFTGLTYSIGISEWLSLGATLQGGIYVSRQASRTVVVNDVMVEQTTFRLMPDFGYQTGISLTLFGDIQLLARYCVLGTPRYEGTRYLDERFFTTIPRRENPISGDPRPVNMFIFSVGYTL